MDAKKLWKRLTANTYLSNFFLMSLFCVLIAIFHNGVNTIKLVLVAMFGAIIFEFISTAIIGRFLFNRKMRCDYPMAAYMGLCIALMLPAAAPAWFPVIGLLVAYAVTGVVIPLTSSSIMRPPRFSFMSAATAISILTILFRKIMFNYAVELSEEAQALNEVPEFFDSVGKLLMTGIADGKTPYSFWDFFTGNITGPIGTTSFILIIAALIFLGLRRPNFVFAPLSFIATVCIWAFIFPRGEIGRFQSIGLELCAGSLLFAATFLLAIPKYLPKNTIHRLIYGAATGMLTMLFRRIGLYEETVCIAILLMNFTLPLFNKRRLSSSEKKKASYKKQLVGDIPIFMKDKRSDDDVLDDFIN